MRARSISSAWVAGLLAAVAVSFAEPPRPPGLPLLSPKDVEFRESFLTQPSAVPQSEPLPGNPLLSITKTGIVYTVQFNTNGLFVLMTSTNLWNWRGELWDTCINGRWLTGYDEQENTATFWRTIWVRPPTNFCELAPGPLTLTIE